MAKDETLDALKQEGDTMEHVISVTVRDKIATKICDTVYICGNSGFVVDFDFDSEWNVHDAKTARFIWEGKYTDVVFTGNRCNVPVISETYSFNVGVFAGNLSTSTPAYCPAKKSILCGSGVPAKPQEDVYGQIMKMINDGMLQGEDGEPGEKGEKGEPGSPGADGFSPTIDVSKEGKTTTLTITDKDGTKTATINDGEDGAGTGGTGGELFIVNTSTVSHTSEHEKCSLDKTFAEIVAAYNAGLMVVCRVNYSSRSGVVIPLVDVRDDFINFAGVSYGHPGHVISVCLYLKNEGNEYGTKPCEYDKSRIQSEGANAPNPYYLTFEDKNGKIVAEYDGSTRVTVKAVPDTFAWSDITGKPFNTVADGTEMLKTAALPTDVFTTAAGEPGEPILADWPFDMNTVEIQHITTPFRLEVGVEYNVSINGTNFRGVCGLADLGEENPMPALGNLGIMSGDLSNVTDFDTPYFLVNVPDGMPAGDAGEIYGIWGVYPLAEEHIPLVSGTLTIAPMGSGNAIVKPEALPVATADTLGGVKVGTGLQIKDGVLSLLPSVKTYAGTLIPNTVYTAELSGSVVFALTTPEDVTHENRIRMLANVADDTTIDWGTTYYYGAAVPFVTEGTYEFLWEYNPLIGAWVAGATRIGQVVSG